MRPSNTELARWFRQDKSDSWDLWKHFRKWQTSFEHGINSLPVVCFRANGNLSTRSIAIPRFRLRVVLRCCVWINSRIRESKQGVANNTQWGCKPRHVPLSSVPYYKIRSDPKITVLFQWRHNERDGVSNHQPRDCLLNGLFKAQIKENIKAPRHWLLWGEFTVDRWIPRTKGQ